MLCQILLHSAPGRPLPSTPSSHAPLSVVLISPFTLFLSVVIIGIVEHLTHRWPDLVTRLITKTPLQLNLRQCTAESLIKIARSSSMSTWCVECKQYHPLTQCLWQLWRTRAILPTPHPAPAVVTSNDLTFLTCSSPNLKRRAIG